MKKFAWILTFVLALSLVMSACGTPAATEAPVVEEAPAAATEAPAVATEAPVVPAEPFRVAVVMPSAINDLAFSQSMYDALMRIQEEMGGPEAFEVVYSENMFVVDDAAAATSASAKTIFADLPPSSRVTRLSWSAALRMMP